MGPAFLHKTRCGARSLRRRKEIFMKVVERGAPVAAVIAAVSTIACCLPLGLVGAFGIASLAVAIQPYRSSLVGISSGLLVITFVQLYIGTKTCRRPARTSVAIFWIATVIVVLILLFPQIIASWIAR
jgi:hypothetical protein